MRQLFRRLHYLINRRRLDAELAADMEFHREMAARAGHGNFGNSTRMQEQAREAWGWTWLDRLVQDLRYGCRILARSPGFTLMAVLVLAIGIGINVSAFSFFNLVALKPLPVRDADRLVRLERRSPSAYTDGAPYTTLRYFAENAKTLSAVMGVMGIPPLQVEDDIEPTPASFITPNYFTELGTTAALGRMFSPSLDGSPSDAPAIMISYGFWQRRFGGDPTVIGRTIHLLKKPVTIIGITPYAFASLGGKGPDIWIPIAQQPYLIDGSKTLSDSGDSAIRMWGKLAPGVSQKTAAEELAALTNQLRQQHPKDIWDNEYIFISPGGHMQVMQPEMYQVAAMVAVLCLLILAVACANLGALQLAKAVTREREITIRVAIGANRGRIFRQLCTESLLLALLGAAAGLGLGYVVLRITLAQLDVPRWLTATPDWRVLLFTLVMSFAAALFFGLAPALQIARQRQHKTIARQVLVTAQIAASSVLLIVAGLMVRATQHALYTDPGFGYSEIVTVDPMLAKHGYTPAAAHAYYDQFQTRLLASPGVKAVALVDIPPLGHIVSRESREIDGHNVTVYPNWVAPGFFQAMNIPLLAGRTFLPNEKNVTIISQSLARQQWHGKNPLGQPIGDGPQKDTVVGVVGDASINDLANSDATEQYWPVDPNNMADMTLVIKMAGDPAAIAPTIKGVSQSLDPELFPEIRQLRLLYRDSVSTVESIAEAVSLIGMVAVLLAAVGIVGLVAFTVTQRTKEIAIRMALGARPATVLAAVLRQFTWPVLIGLLCGTGIAAAASRLLRRGLYGVSNLDPGSYAGALCFLVAILALAAVLPARRALRLDLAKTLHYE
jgi:predicted permease